MCIRISHFCAQNLQWLSFSLRLKATSQWSRGLNGNPLSHISPLICHSSPCPFCLSHTGLNHEPPILASGSLLCLLPLPVILLPQIFPLLILSFKSLFKCHLIEEDSSDTQASYSLSPLPCYTDLLAHHLKYHISIVCTHFPQCKLHVGKVCFF